MPGTKFKQLKNKNPDIESYLAKVAKVESGNNPNAQNPYGSATGLFQFTESTWKGLNERYGFGYNLEDRKNPEKSANVMRKFTQDNEGILSSVVSRDINDADRYMAHFLGAGGAKKFFLAYNANPNAPISSVVSSDALKSNKSVFYKKDGSLKTVSDIYDWANNKMNVKVEPKVYTSSGEIPTKGFDKNIYIDSKPSSLETSSVKYTEENDTEEVQQAKQDISEKSFLQDLSQIFQQSTQDNTQIPQQEVMELDPSAYNYINLEEY